MCPYKNDEGEIIPTEEISRPQGHKAGMEARRAESKIDTNMEEEIRRES